MKTNTFVHLHLHTDYSLLDSTIRINALVAKAREYGMSAVAITDSDNLCGALEFYLKCTKAGIKPLIGAEISVTSVLPNPEKLHDQAVYKVVLLCMDLAGYRSLCRIVSAACAKGFQEITPITPGILAGYSDGLICLSGGRTGELSVLCRQGSAEAKSVTAWYDEHFPDRYYVELFPEPSHTLPTLISIAQSLNIPLVAAADCRCLTLEDVRVYQVLQSIKAGIPAAMILRDQLIDPLFFSPEEMAEMFGGRPEVLTTTQAIADRCHLELLLVAPDRSTLPDSDPGKDHPGTIFDHLVEKYGKNSVYRSSTFATFSDSDAFRDVGRALEMDASYVRLIRRMYYHHINERYPGCESSLPRLRKQNLPRWRRAGSNSSSKLNDLAKNDPQVNEVLAMVLGLRGLIRTRMLGTDAVIITPGDLRDYLPVAGDLTTGMFVSQYPMKHLWTILRKNRLLKC